MKKKRPILSMVLVTVGFLTVAPVDLGAEARPTNAAVAVPASSTEVPGSGDTDVLARRQQDVADAAAASLGSTYAGAYISDDDVVVIRGTGPSNGIESRLASTTEVRVRYEQARFSQETLADAARLAAEEMVTGDVVGFYMESVRDNKVLIGLEPDRDSDRERDAVLTRLGDKADGQSEVFRFVTYLGGEEETPILGGDRLTYLPPSTLYCSMGAWGFRWYGSLQVPHLVTAGHCDNQLRHFGHAPTYNTQLEYNAAAADAQSMTPATGFGEWTTNVAGGFDIINVVSSGGAFDTSGHGICKSGATTGVTCGTLWSNNSGCREHTGMRIADYYSEGGDSGATVFSSTFPGVALAGIHEGTCLVDLGGGPFLLRQYTFQAHAAWILQLDGWYT